MKTNSSDWQRVSHRLCDTHQPMHAVLALLLLAGEPVRFDGKMTPQFTDNQLRNTAESTRAGLTKWAATPHGRRLMARFNSSEYEIRVAEDAGEDGAGRAPQPGIAELVQAGDHSRRKIYRLILNPRFNLPKGFQPFPSPRPARPADVMAAAWAAEMLHIDFYARGISLPHHRRTDFQEEWRELAAEIGFPLLTHDDDSEMPLIVISSAGRN